jgi:hypothetical protein
VNGAGHDWHLTNDFSTPELIWEFFSEFEFFVGVEENQELVYEVRAFPNPSTSGIFQLDQLKFPIGYKLYSSNGALLKSETMLDQSILDLSSYSNGVYTLILEAEEGVIKPIRLIIN